MSSSATKHPVLDLSLERVIDLQPWRIWEMWTKPDLLCEWFTPAPWIITECEIDLRPGGIFHTVMRSPEGIEYPNTACFMEIVPNKRLVWTNAIAPGLRPLPRHTDNGVMFTAIITVEPHRKGSFYTATALHGDQRSCRNHHAMGFHEGWGKSLDQMVACARRLDKQARAGMA